MGHSVSDSAARAVQNSAKVASVKQTQEEKIKLLYGNLACGAAIPRHQTEALVAEYDRVCAENAAQAIVIQDLTRELEVAKEQYQASVRVITSRNHEIVDLQAHSQQALVEPAEPC